MVRAIGSHRRLGGWKKRRWSGSEEPVFLEHGNESEYAKPRNSGSDVEDESKAKLRATSCELRANRFARSSRLEARDSQRSIIFPCPSSTRSRKTLSRP